MKSVWFRTEGRPLRVDVDDPELASQVEALFPTLALTAGPDVAPLASFRRAGPERFHVAEAGRREAMGHALGLSEALSLLEFLVFRALLRPWAREAHLHAAGTIVDGRAVLAVGASGAGKSTVALAWAQAGLPVIADDLVLVDRLGRARGIPRLLKVHRDRLAEHRIPVRYTVAPDPDDPEVWWRPRPGGWYSGWAPVGLVALIGYRPGASNAVERATAPRGLQHLLAHTLDTGLGREECIDRFLPLAERATVVHMEFGEAREAAALLAHMAAGLEGGGG